MSIGSPNKTIVATLIETLQFKVESNKLYDALKKIVTDLNKVYEALFDGPLPSVSGKFLNLTETPNDNFPDNVAFKNEENVFIKNQNITKLIPSFEFNNEASPGAVPGYTGRVIAISDTQFLISEDINWDGTNYTSATGTGTGIIFNSNGEIHFVAMIAGVFTILAKIMPPGILCLGVATTTVGAAINEFLLKNNKSVRGENLLATNTFSMIKVNALDLVVLAADAASTGKGHLAIPESTAANLPAASANQNGTIVIDTTNKRLCFYTAGLRYYAAGTAF